MTGRLLSWLLVLLVLAVPAGALAATPEQERALTPPDLPALQAEVEQVRELEFLRPVVSEDRTLAEAGAYVREMLRDDLGVPSTRLREVFLRALGLLPEGAGLEGLLGRLFGEQVRGIYDPHRGVFVVVRGAPDDGAAAQLLPVLGLDLAALYTLHELEHAMQDQHFRLLEKERETGERFDRTLAFQALAEGDANLVMFEAAARRLGVDPELMVEFLGRGLSGGGVPGMDAYPEYQAAPRFMREYLTMPYFGGLQFVAAVRKAGGWKRVDEAFRSLPASTEQVLHPEKFLAGEDPPVEVDLSALPAELGGRTCLGDDTAGEFVIRVWGEEHLGPEAGRDAAAGWGGDSWRVYGAEGSDFVLWATVWDTEADARDFEALARKAARDGRIERRGAQVLVMLDVPDELAEAASRAAWKMKTHR